MIRLYKSTFRFIFPLALLFYISCSSGDWSKKTDWKDFDQNNIPTQQEYPECEAIVLIDEGSVHIFSENQMAFSTYNRHTVTKIFTSRGYHFANVVIPYGSQSDVEDIEARTISPSGKITVLDPETIFDVNLYPNFVFYSDQRAKSIHPPGC